MKKIFFSSMMAVAMAFTSPVMAAGDAGAGKKKSEVCIACHGVDGNSPSDMFPKLAGQHESYIIKQLADFKSGARANAVMAPMVANLTEQDMADLGAFFESQPRSVQSATTDDVAVSTDSPAPVANTEVVTSTPAKAIYAGDVKAGQEKSAMCVACHGTDGNSVVPMYPKLAGQSASYLAKQLADFKSGARVDPVMAGMVAGLSTTDMDDLAAYYAVQTSTAGTGATDDIGRKLYFGGDVKKGITACIACHGIKGKGMAQAGFPAVAGQNADYLKKQINTFRDGSRSNDNNKIMRNIAIKLSDSDVEAVVKYMSALK